MKTLVTSDVHLGSRSLDPHRFTTFLKTVNDGDHLILNGDIVNRNCPELPPEHRAALDVMRDLSKRASVTWIRGNHDENFKLDDPANIDFVDFCLIEDGVGILHGHDFRHSRVRNRLLVYVLRAIYAVRKHFTRESGHLFRRFGVHPMLATILRYHIRANAISLAKEKHLHTVICGHVHIAEISEHENITYVNCGTWLKKKANVATIDKSGVNLTDA